MSDNTHNQPLRGLANLSGDPVIGTQVSGYVVKARLGSGGMGIVYEGEQPIIGKRVAIKVLRPEVAGNPDVVQRLVAEARAVNQVGHRGIIDVFGFGDLPDGRQCIVMEYLDGESLEQIINTLRGEHRLMPLAEVLGILDEMLSALAAAHSAGVIHRDLKPSNIFLCQQRDGTRYVKVLDFGLAKLGSTGQSNSSLMMGTPAYMAPEQARGLVSPSIDLYAVGCIAYELITGQQLFQADSVIEMLMKHQKEEPTRPSVKVRSLPEVVDEFVLKLLQKKPENRYQTADEARDVIAPGGKELTKSSARTPALAQKVTLSPSMEFEAVDAKAVPSVDRQVSPPQQREPTGETPELPRSKAPLVVVLGALALVGVAAAFMFGGSSGPEKLAPAVVTPTPTEVKPKPSTSLVVRGLEPVAEAKVEAPVANVEPQPTPAVDEPLVAPGQVEPAKPVVAVAKLTRGEQLLKRLKQLEKLVPPASSDFRILTKLRGKIVKNEGLDQIQSGLDSLEAKYRE
jgi:eukaryotic-like serine/threonine-protein kinase